MKSIILLGLLAVSANAKETNLFNGKDLTGWNGDPKFWSVQDGALTGKSTPDNVVLQNTFLIWKDGTPSDFTLTVKFKMTPGNAAKSTNSGVQYRSKVTDAEKFIVSGYQADFEYGEKWSGILYEERGRGILAKRGEKVILKQGVSPEKPLIEVVGETSKSEDIQASIKKDDWNEYKIIAKGNNVQQFINGKLSVDVTDETAEAPKSGVIALQLHQGPPMQIQFKDLILITEE